MRNLNKFTNLYELSKTLRFELIPKYNTPQMLEDNKVFKKDEILSKNYKEVKNWFDKLHREFIDDALHKTEISSKLLKDYEQAYFKYKNEKSNSNKKKIEDEAKKIRKNILINFEKILEEWKNKYLKKIRKEELKTNVRKLKKLDLFFKKEIFDFLKYKYPEAVIDDKSIFESFNKFSTYFNGFHQTRKNFYKDDGTSTAIPTRIVNENLPKFLENQKQFENKYKGKHDDIFNKVQKDIFNLKYFNNCLSQGQIDQYNDLIAEINKKVNFKRQKTKNKNDLPFFKILFKQIMGERTARDIEQSGFIEITQDNEVFKVMNDFIKENKLQNPKAFDLFNEFIEDQLANRGNFNISNIYVAGRFINQISNKWFADWNFIRSLFIEKGQKKLPDFVSIAELKEKLQNIEIKDRNDIFRDKYKDIFSGKESDNYIIFLKIWQSEFNENFKGNKEKKGYEEVLQDIEAIIKKDKLYKNILRQKEIIRDYCESSLSIYQMIKYFSLEKGKERLWNPDSIDEDSLFYDRFNDYYQNVHTWQYYNVFRNYLTQKPYSEDKIKLNFECGTLLDGWDKNKEQNNLGVILKKKGKYYLGIMKKNHNDIFLDKYQKGNLNDKRFYKKMVYKLMADPKRDFPKGIFSNKGIKEYRPNKELLDIYRSGSFKIDSPAFSIKNMHKIIDFFKECIPKHPSWSLFSFNHIKPTKQYKKNIGEFYNDLSKNTWKIWFENISEKYIKEKNNSGELFLFEIHNKDFNSKAEGKKNLHTFFWEEIFSERNQNNPIIKLNGQAEVFFRKASLDKEVDKKRKTSVEVINKKRYTENKVFFHCPLTLNFARDEVEKDNNKYKGKADSFSVSVREYLANNKDVNIIGIDRGEKHLAYYSVIDQRKNILETRSFNEINGTDYHKKLSELEEKRAEARKNWQIIGKIKEMKKGYISQLVKKICNLMIEYNAIIIFEDLNAGFKRGRFAIEKQVYQNLELALAKKLNYLVFKDRDFEQVGSATKAFQLTPKINNFKDIYRQCGFIFYVPASYTSAICPVCGFRKNIPTKIDIRSKNKQFIEKFDIIYEKEKDRFRFTYRRKDVIEEKKKTSKSKSGFTLFDNKEKRDEFVFYSDVTRLQYLRRKDNRGGETKWIYPNEELKNIFKKNNIEINKENIIKQIQGKNLGNGSFYKPIIHNIRLILQLRNAIVEKDNSGNEIKEKCYDFIECPSCHFHSESNLKNLKSKYSGREPFVFNGDANGAYNIARKGILVLDKISKFKKKFSDLSKMENGDLLITQDEWDQFVS